MTQRKCPVCGEEMVLIDADYLCAKHRNRIWIPMGTTTYADRMEAEVDRLRKEVEWSGKVNDSLAERICNVNKELDESLSENAALAEIERRRK